MTSYTRKLFNRDPRAALAFYHQSEAEEEALRHPPSFAESMELRAELLGYDRKPVRRSKAGATAYHTSKTTS